MITETFKMKKYFPVVITVLALLVSGCASMGLDSDTSDLRVETEVNEKANLSDYKTYSWVAVAAVLNDPEGQWKPPGFKAGTFIKDQIDIEMKDKGYILTDGSADLGVAFFLGIDMKSQKLKFNSETNRDEMQNVPAGALVVVLVDTRTGIFTWIGQATGEDKKNAEGENIVNDEISRKRLQYVVSEMFDSL